MPGPKPQCDCGEKTCRICYNRSVQANYRMRRQAAEELIAVTGLKRTPLKRKTPLKKYRSKPRKVAVLRDPKYKAWLRENCECLICVKTGVPINAFCGRVEAAHVLKTNGMGSKGPDSGCIPLGKGHHRELHNRGAKDFSEKYAISLEFWAALYFDRYRLENILAESLYTDGLA